MLGVSTDSHFSHLAWINLSRKQGGLGGLQYPLVSDFNKTISRDYGVLIEEAGIALRSERVHPFDLQPWIHIFFLSVVGTVPYQ